MTSPLSFVHPSPDSPWGTYLSGEENWAFYFNGPEQPDAVVSVSAVSRWYVRDTTPMQRVHWLLETGLGRRLGATTS